METNPKLAALFPEERRLVQSWLAEFGAQYPAC